MVFFLTYKKKINPDMTCKAPPCAMNGRFLLEGDSDFSRSSIVLHRFLRPTRSRPLLSFRPRLFGTAAGYQGEPQARLLAPLTGFSSPPIFPEGLLAFSSDIDEKMETKSDGLDGEDSGGRSEMDWGFREHCSGTTWYGKTS